MYFLNSWPTSPQTSTIQKLTSMQNSSLSLSRKALPLSSLILTSTAPLHQHHPPPENLLQLDLSRLRNLPFCSHSAECLSEHWVQHLCTYLRSSISQFFVVVVDGKGSPTRIHGIEKYLIKLYVYNYHIFAKLTNDIHKEGLFVTNVLNM